jgi:prevent-host-death family protein
MCYLVGMERIGVRELRQHATRYLGRVKAGETVEVTERGQLVALLVPPAPGATGQLVPASRPFRVPRRAPLPAAGPSTGAALDDLRAERT